MTIEDIWVYTLMVLLFTPVVILLGRDLAVWVRKGFGLTSKIPVHPWFRWFGQGKRKA